MTESRRSDTRPVTAPADRRRFLSRAAAPFALWPLVPVARLAAGSGGSPRRPKQDEEVPEWVRRARREIPAAVESRYFQTGGIGPSPNTVIAEVRERLEFQNRSPADPRYSAPMAEVEPALRSQLARVFGAGEDEVALTHSTSEGISIAAWSLDWRAGDEVVISNTEHPANVIPWYVLRDRFGIGIRVMDLSPGTDLLAEARKHLTPRSRMLSVSHVSRNNGRRLRAEESAELGSLLRERGVLYHLDGAQGPGAVAVNFRELGSDCYSTCGHKWLLGPKGTGALFVRRESLDAVQLSWAGAHSHAEMDYDGGYRLLPSAARYEFGTRALADFAGFGRAVEWMESVGLRRIEERIASLVDYAGEAARRAGVLSVSSPETPEDRSGVFVVRLPEGADATALYRRLAEERRILGSPVRRDRDFRLSIHFFNTREEIEAALEAIAAAV